MKRWNWNELKEIIEKKEFEKLGRFPEELQKYKMILNQIKEEFFTIDDFILYKFFKFPYQIQNGKKKIIFLKTEDIQKKILVLNDFPYAIEEGIQHYLLWSLHELTLLEIEEFLKQTFSIQKKDYLYFINPENLKSIKNIFHIHIFVKNKY